MPSLTLNTDTPRRQVVLTGLLIAGIGVFYLLTLRAGHSWGGDFSMYINHARNLTEGRPYGATGFILNPENPIAPRTCPPVFPFLLAPLYGWLGLNLKAMQVEAIALFLAALCMMAALFRKELSPNALLALLAIVGLNPLIWSFKEEVMSDVPFLVFAYATLALVLRAERSSGAGARHTREALVAGLALVLAYGTRSIGLVLLPSMALADLIRFRRLTRLTLIAAIPFAAYLVVQQLFLHSDRDYLVQFGNSPQVIVSHFTYYTKELRDLWRNSYSGFIMRTLFLLVNGLGVFGYLAMLTRRPTAREIFPLLYAAVILSWPHYQGIRFLLPLIPLYVFYALVGLQRLPVPRRPASRRLAVRALVGTILISYAARYTTRNFGPLKEGVAQPDTIALFDYVKRRTDEDAVVVFAKPRVLYLYTGRRAAVYHVTGGDESLLRFMREIQADYAILCPIFFWDANFFRGFLERQDEHFEPVYANPTFTMYRFAPSRG